MRSFLATPFYIFMFISGFTSLMMLTIACSIQGIDTNEFLENKMNKIRNR